MVQIPVKDELNWALDHPMVEELPRHYLGMSMIGEPCDRYLQYYLRWAHTIKLERRIRRLFDFGHIAEEQMTKELERIGCVISNQQQEFIGFGGHWQGHIDGNICIVPGKGDFDSFLLEFKTHNHKWFKVLQKQGVQKGFPKHYDQCQRYLAADPVLEACMYIGYNKDDSEFLIEFIEPDEPRQKELKRKEQHILLEDKLFPRIGTGQSTWHECRFCDAKQVCFGKKEVRQGCRTCKHVEIHEEGHWRCAYHQKGLGLEYQAKGCDDYELDGEFFDSD